MERLLLCLMCLSLTVIQLCFADNSNSTAFGFPSNLTRLSAESACTTLKNKKGTCVSIFKCPKMFGVYQKGSQATPNETKMVRDAYCGYWKSGAPYVCCESSNAPSRLTATTATKTPFPLEPLTEEEKKQCGISKVKFVSKISGGKNATLSAWPWMAALHLRHRKSGVGRVGCGGSLISNQWVLTAAHCIPDSSSIEQLDYVRLGDLDIDKTIDDGASPIEVKIKRIIKHPRYSSKPVLNDIALLHLSEPVTYTTHVRPICLHSGEQYRLDKTYYDTKKSVVTGWGDTSYLSHTTTLLLEVELNMVTYEECKKDYDSFIKDGKVKIDETVLCSYKRGKDACQGDSGGPLMFLEKGGGWSQGGIVSLGYKCAEERYPGVYTKVAVFIDWINESTGLNF